MKHSEIFDAIIKERERQEQLHPGQTLGHPIEPPLAITILLEEVGECARAVLERDKEQLKKELIEVAACCTAWLETM